MKPCQIMTTNVKSVKEKQEKSLELCGKKKDLCVRMDDDNWFLNGQSFDWFEFVCDWDERIKTSGKSVI